MRAWLDSDDIKMGVLRRPYVLDSLRRLPRLFGMPKDFGFALRAMKFDAGVVAAIAPGADLRWAAHDLLAEILRHRKGSEHPMAVQAVAEILQAVEKRDGLQEASNECEYARKTIARKMRDREPAKLRAYEACYLGELIGTSIKDDAVYEAFTYATSEKDFTQELKNWFIAHLGRIERDADYDPDFDPFWS